nr:ORF3 [Epsilontorquevirus sp.]
MTREEYKSRIRKRRNRGRSYTTGTSGGATSPSQLLNALCNLTPQTPIRSTAPRKRRGEPRSPSPPKRKYSQKTSICTYPVPRGILRRTGRRPETPSSTDSETEQPRQRASRKRYTRSGRRRRKTSITSASTSDSSDTEWTSTAYSSGDSPPPLGAQLGGRLRTERLQHHPQKEPPIYR